jgi:hypothetical protein
LIKIVSDETLLNETGDKRTSLILYCLDFEEPPFIERVSFNVPCRLDNGVCRRLTVSWFRSHAMDVNNAKQQTYFQNNQNKFQHYETETTS